MSLIDQLSFKSPGYPVYKASVIPKVVEGKVSYVSEVTPEVVEKWKKVLKKLKEFIGCIFEQNIVRNYNREELYEFLADMIALFFKLPLIREPLPSVAPSPMKVYLLYRINYKQIKKDIVNKGLIDFADISYGEAIDKLLGSKLGGLFQDAQLYMLVEDSWFSIPADTRPVANTSGLIPHLLTTSCIAWSLAVNKRMSREEAAKVRLIALFHDMGKPFNYKEHYKESPKIVDYVLSDINVLNEIKEELKYLVEKHHAEAATDEAKIIKDADAIASSSDRLEAISKLVKDEIRNMAEECGLNVENAYAGGKRSWEFWEKLESCRKGILKELSERFAILLSEVKPDSDLIKNLKEGKEHNNIRLCLIDIGGIQDFITRTKDLRCVIASSLLIDVAVMAHLPLIIQLELEEKGYWVPYESFLYTSGGIITFVLPLEILENLEGDVWQKIRKDYARSYLDIYLADTAFNSSYLISSSHLASKMGLKKLNEEALYNTPKTLEINEGEPRLCVKCYLENSTIKIEDTGEEVCYFCYKLYNLGSEMHFKHKWESELLVGTTKIKPPEAFEGYGWSDISSKSIDIMYIIAGHDIDELQKLGFIEGPERGYIKKRNLAVIKVDGNLMGAFFARSVSITDAMERSARVDIALKESLEKALENLLDGIKSAGDYIDIEQNKLSKLAEQAAVACKLGLLYMGGDDSLILCPSWVSIPLAIQLASYFSEKMGWVRSLSVGLVAAPPEHDVWALIEASNALLDKAKEVGRKSRSKGAICFDVVEGGTLSSSSALARLKDLKENKISTQPLLIGKDGNESSFTIDELIEFLGFTTDHKDMFKRVFIVSRSENNKIKDKLKKIRETLLTSINVGKYYASDEKSLKISVVFVNREDRNEFRVLAEVFRSWLKKLEKEEKLGFPASDLDRLIKILGGGMI